MQPEKTRQLTSFLGTGWSFPPEFVKEGAAADVGRVVMTSDEEDIRASLSILLSTAQGERYFHPKYGLDMRDQVFEALGTTAETYLRDRVRDGILIYEPRIEILALELDTGFDPARRAAPEAADSERRFEGVVQLRLEYRIRTTNSRYNHVFPFYQSGDAIEWRGAGKAAASVAA